MTKENDNKAELYQYYWQEFDKRMKKNGSTLSMSPTTSKRKYGRKFISDPTIIAPKGLFIVATISLLAKEYEARGCVEVLIEYPTSPAYRNLKIDYNREAFKQLKDDEPAIKDDLGDDLKLVWMPRGERPRKNSKKPRARISCFKFFNSKEEKNWHEHYPWFIETIGKFDAVFTHRLNEIHDNR